MANKFVNFTIENYHSPERFYLAEGHETNPVVVETLASQARFDGKEGVAQQIENGTYFDPTDIYVERDWLPSEAILVKFRRNSRLWYWIGKDGEKHYDWE